MIVLTNIDWNNFNNEYYVLDMDILNKRLFQWYFAITDFTLKSQTSLELIWATMARHFELDVYHFFLQSLLADCIVQWQKVQDHKTSLLGLLCFSLLVNFDWSIHLEKKIEQLDCIFVSQICSTLKYFNFCLNLEWLCRCNF